MGLSLTSWLRPYFPQMTFLIGHKLGQRTPELKETAWLDGLRGVAAFLVVMNHYSLEWLGLWSDAPFGATVLKDVNPYDVYYYEAGTRFWGIWRLPILRILMSSGNAQVAIFFVLSGFVLSWRPIELLRDGRLDVLLSSLSSSMVRRWFRLYLPCFFVMIFYHIQDLVAKGIGGRSAVGKMVALIWMAGRWANPFKTDYMLQVTANPPGGLGYPMWTIPFEFSGSVFVFGFMLALSRVQDFRRRITVIVAISLYAFFSAFWNYWLFGFGLALADYVRQAGGCEKLSQRESSVHLRLWAVVLAVGLVMMGYVKPLDSYTTPGYEWTQYVPLPEGYAFNRARVWWGWGGILVVASLCHLAPARRVLEIPMIQYLGKISFMLYLTHLLVNLVISLPLRRIIYSVLCSKMTHGPFTDVYRTNSVLNVLIFFFLLFVSVLIAIGLAHLLERWVDRPCTAFARWMDMKLVNGFGVSAQSSATHERAILLQHQEADEQAEQEHVTTQWEQHSSNTHAEDANTTMGR